ncbi:MAG: hypothetical protein FD180_158 [Planctomycetota bacterium]|nr:MAG: hypothetical protein FD180_158 [Planctomycetota bacterium]
MSEEQKSEGGMGEKPRPWRRPRTGRRRQLGVPLPPGSPPSAGRNNPNRFRWEGELAAKLGQVHDKVVAKEAGVAPGTVAQERLRRGIPAFKGKGPLIEWNPAMDARLGKDSDAIIGRELGVPAAAVSYRRRRLGVPAYGVGGRVRIVLPPGAIAKMGTAPDKEVGAEFGVSGYVVSVERKARGIKSFQKPRPKVKWTAEMIACFDTHTDRELAERYNITPPTVVRKRLQLQKRRDSFSRKWTPEEKALLGKFTDVANARRLGITEAMVKSMRDHEGIPPLYVAAPVVWTKEDDARLGKETDEAIAADKGCSVGAVLNRRQELRVASNRRQKRELLWSKDDDALLGKDSDVMTAKLLDRTPRAITRRRLELGVPPFRTKKNTVTWNPEHDKVLGTMSDADAAKTLNVPEARVRWRRRALGIAMFEERWPPEAPEAPGRVPSQ